MKIHYFWHAFCCMLLIGIVPVDESTAAEVKSREFDCNVKGKIESNYKTKLGIEPEYIGASSKTQLQISDARSARTISIIGLGYWITTTHPAVSDSKYVRYAKDISDTNNIGIQYIFISTTMKKDSSNLPQVSYVTVNRRNGEIYGYHRVEIGIGESTVTEVMGKCELNSEILK